MVTSLPEPMVAPFPVKSVHFVKVAPGDNVDGDTVDVVQVPLLQV